MYVGYYTAGRFPFPQGNDGPYNAFVGRPCITRRSMSKADTLGYFRPNQGVQRVYINGLGDVMSDPGSTTLLIAGAVALVGTFLLFKGGKKVSHYRKRARKRSARRLRAKAALLEA